MTKRNNLVLSLLHVHILCLLFNAKLNFALRSNVITSEEAYTHESINNVATYQKNTSSFDYTVNLRSRLMQISNVTNDATLSINNIFDETSLSSAIVGGYEVKSANRFPYLVSILQEDNDNPGQAFHVCGGTLIAPDVVLCAAHCVDKKDNDSRDSDSSDDDDKDIVRYVQTGRFEFDSLSGSSSNDVDAIETFEIIDYALCDDWLSYYWECDVALLRLSGHSNVNPITLSKDASNMHEGEKVTAVGWGLLSTNGDVPKVLHEVQLEMINEDNCKDHFGDLISDTVMCAHSDGKDTCDGDSGKMCRFVSGKINTINLCKIINYALVHRWSVIN